MLITAVFLVSLAGVCAADANDTIVTSEDNLEIDQTTNDAIGVGEDTDLASFEENEILTEGEQTFAQLNTTINGNTNKDIYLNGNYKYSEGDGSFKGGIAIERDVNVYGNGAVIDGNKEARIFNITGGNVVFYNITFVNGSAMGGYGGAIYGNCKAINCTFKENRAFYGGAIFVGSAVNCTFYGNYAKYDGGAMDNGSAMNCIFNSNEASCGGAMFEGSVVNCTFYGNTAKDGGGAIYYGSAVNCIFNGNVAAVKGGAILIGYIWNCTFQDNDNYNTHDLVLHWEANNFTTSYGSAEKLHIQLKNQANDLIDFINYDLVIYEGGAYVKTYHCLSNEGLSPDLAVGIYAAELTVTYPGLNQSDSKNITLTINKSKTQIAASAVTATYNVKKNLVITLKDANGNPLSGVEVTVKIKKAKTYTTDSKGKIKINVAKLVPKKYTAKITFAGNANYTSSSANAKVTVKKAKPKMTAKKKTFKVKKPKKYKITLKTNKGKVIKKAKVTLKVKGKTYKAKTDAKGKATFKIKKLTMKGTFKSTVKYAGNAYYKTVTKTVKIKIK